MLQYCGKCFVADEATVVVKLEKKEADVAGVVPTSKESLLSCFCPHGYSTATSGHFHCRHCGLSCRSASNVIRHEKVHADYLADKANSSQGKRRRYFNCRHCGFLSNTVKNIRRHEKRVHAKSRKTSNDQQLQTPCALSTTGTGILLETTAKRLKVSGNCAIGQFSLFLILCTLWNSTAFCIAILSVI